MYLFKQSLVVNLMLLSVGNKCQESQFDYKIEVPKLCDKKDDLKTGVTTIRLSGKDAQRLQYDFAVNYTNITFCKQSQRCTLTAWRAVRNLEKHLRNICKTQKTLEQIPINNTMLIPGIQYILSVSVKNNGTRVDSKEFILECTNNTTDTVNGSAMHLEESSHTSLVLLGSNVTYRDIIYILNAEAIDCDVNCSYYFNWEILDDSENLLLEEATKGSELQISFSTLGTAEEYVIRCKLLDTRKNTMIAKAVQSVKLLRKDMILRLAISTLVVGLKQAFQLNAYVKNFDGADEKIKVEWLCKRDNQEKCLGFEDSRSNYQDKWRSITLESKGLAVTGRYNITVVVRKDNIVKQDSCEVQVVEDGFAQIDVDNIAEPVDPLTEIEVPVYVSYLVAKCMLQWVSIKRRNYAYLDLSTVPGNINAITNITLTEDEFLNEIDEFSNGTVDIDYNLKIPAPKGDWKGLVGNSTYLFRLNITCPVVQDTEYNDEDAEPLLLQSYMALYADVALHTDPSPILNLLDVIPKEGVALKTLFKFIYQTNSNDGSHNLMLYKFGYFLNDQIIFISNLFGVSNTKSVLPYSDGGVKTVLEGCNSYSLCAQIFGPVVITEAPPFSSDDQNYLMMQLRDLMNREEYYKVFTSSLAIMETYNNTYDKNVSDSMQNFVSNLTSNEIKRLLMLSADGDKMWRASANNLMKNIGILLNNVSASEILLNNVVALRNELSSKNVLKLEVETVNHSSRKLLMVNTPQRFKRETEKMTLEEVKSYIVISELIITSSADRKRVRQEKQNILNQIDKFMQELCATLYEKSQTMNLELRTVILSVEKINKNAFNRYAHILYVGNAWDVNGRIKLGRCFTEKLKSRDQLCLGKAAFKNYMGKKGIVYMVKIYDSESDDQLDSEDALCDSVLVLPVDEQQSKQKEPKCTLWKNRWVQSQCKTLQVTKTIQCTCSSLGYYSLDYIAYVTTASTTTVTVSTTALTSTTTEKDMLNDLQTVTETTTVSDNAFPLLQNLSTVTALELTESSITSADTELVRYTESVKHTETFVYSESILYTELLTYTPVSTEENVTILKISPLVTVSSNNTLSASFYVPTGDDDVVFYLIIGFSIAGILVLIYGIRHTLSKNRRVSDKNFPKYALLYHQEMLQDLPNNT